MWREGNVPLVVAEGLDSEGKHCRGENLRELTFQPADRTTPLFCPATPRGSRVPKTLPRQLLTTECGVATTGR